MENNPDGAHYLESYLCNLRLKTLEIICYAFKTKSFCSLESTQFCFYRFLVSFDTHLQLENSFHFVFYLKFTGALWLRVHV